MALIRALFPELASRVFFQRAPAQHRLTVSVHTFQASFYLLPQEERAAMDVPASSDVYRKGARATRMVF